MDISELLVVLRMTTLLGLAIKHSCFLGKLFRSVNLKQD